jgi:DNA-binding XRE family transcriptional regulator
MAQKPIVSHVRTHRKRSGLTQCELARLLGYRNSGRVSRHERGITVPSLNAALSYEILFRVPICDLFPALHEAVVKNIEGRLSGMESLLGQKSARERDANRTAQKLQFIWSRKSGTQI